MSELRMSAAAFRAYRALRGAVNAAQAQREIARARFVRKNHDGTELWRLPRDVFGERLRLYAREGEVYEVRRESDRGEPGKGQRSQKRHEMRRAARRIGKLMEEGQIAGLPKSFRDALDGAVRSLVRAQAEADRRFAEAIQLVKSSRTALEHGDRSEAARLLADAAELEEELTGECAALTEELFVRLGLEEVDS